ncbi:putative ribonuclease H-like domain-containing protein [Tanacetum coccineum]
MHKRYTLIKQFDFRIQSNWPQQLEQLHIQLSDYEDVGAEADINNLNTFMPVSPIPTTRIHIDHLVEQIIRDLNSTPQTRRMPKSLEEHDPDFPDRVYKVEKALYGPHQAPRAWYEMLSTYLLGNGFQRGKIDKTLFIRRDKEFEKMMHKKFQMSSMGELTFFLGMQVKQKEDEIFISQGKYVTEILKKFGFTNDKTTSTPMETQKSLLKDEDGEEVDVHLYRSMIGSLMYLTSLRPDIMFAVCACARYQVNPKVSHLHAVKRIFRYLKSQHKLGLWYLKDSPFDLVAYTDSDYCKKETVVANSTIEAEYVAASSCYGQVLWIQNQLLDYGAKTTAWNEFSSTMTFAIICLATNQKFNFSKYIFESMVKNLDNAVKFLMYPRFVQVFLNNQLEGMMTHNTIYIALSHTKKIFANMRRQGKDFSSRVTPLFPTIVVQAQEEMGEGSAMPTDSHHTPTITQPSSSQPQRKQKSRRHKEKDTQAPQSSVPSDPINIADEAVTEEPSMQLKELMDFYIKLQQRVLNLENTKTAQAQEIISLKKRGRIDDIDADKDIYLFNVHRDEDMFRVNDLEGDEVVVESKVADKDVNLSVDEVTLAQALAALKSAKVSTVILTTAATTIIAVSLRPRAKGIVFHEQEQEQKQAPTPIVSSQQPRQVKDKAEEERLAREKAQRVEESNIAWDDIQAKVEVDYQMAQRLQAQEQEELSDAEKATLFVQLLEKRRKHFLQQKEQKRKGTNHQ